MCVVCLVINLDSHRLLRETVLGIACQMGDQEMLHEASAIFAKWITDNIR